MSLLLSLVRYCSGMSFFFARAETKKFLNSLIVPKAATVPGRIGEEFLQELVDEVFRFYSVNAPFYDETVPEPLKISATWASLLKQTRRQQLRAIAESDHATYQGLLGNLFQSELMSGLWNYGSRVERGLSPDFIKELQSLRVETSLELHDLCVGNPYPSAWGFPVDDRKPHVISHVAPSHFRQATHISRALKTKLISEHFTRPVVMDLGSGFGGMANFLTNMAPTASDIVLIDIPLNLTTAYAYLRVTNPDGLVTLVTSQDQLQRLAGGPANDLQNRIILVPSILASEAARLFPPSILHNAQSLSEMGRETIQFYLETLVVQTTRVVIDSNVADPFVTVNSGYVEVGSNEISEVLTGLGMSLLARNIRDSGSRYVVSTHVRV